MLDRIRFRADGINSKMWLGDFEFPREFACGCCGKCDILYEVWWACQLLRCEFGKPLTVHSGYRCARHNQAVGGKPESDHLSGFAADISIDGHPAEELRLAATNLPSLVKRIGVYEPGPAHGDFGFIHIGVRERGPGTWKFWRFDSHGNKIESR